MGWLDRPISSRTGAFLACLALGFAAALLGSQVGMSALNALFFAGMIAASLIELVDYVANREGEPRQSATLIA
jgi:hypothetical protein